MQTMPRIRFHPWRLAHVSRALLDETRTEPAPSPPNKPGRLGGGLSLPGPPPRWPRPFPVPLPPQLPGQGHDLLEGRAVLERERPQFDAAGFLRAVGVEAGGLRVGGAGAVAAAVQLRRRHL